MQHLQDEGAEKERHLRMRAQQSQAFKKDIDVPRFQVRLPTLYLQPRREQEHG
jgi:hypothetical protein